MIFLTLLGTLLALQTAFGMGAVVWILGATGLRVATLRDGLRVWVAASNVRYGLSGGPEGGYVIRRVAGTPA